MSETRLNKNICIIEIHMTVGQIIDILAKKRYPYTAIRCQKQEAGSEFFYACRSAQLLSWIENPASFSNISDNIGTISLIKQVNALRKKLTPVILDLPLFKILPLYEAQSTPLIYTKTIQDLTIDKDDLFGANFFILNGMKPQLVIESNKINRKIPTKKRPYYNKPQNHVPIITTGKPSKQINQQVQSALSTGKRLSFKNIRNKVKVIQVGKRGNRINKRSLIKSIQNYHLKRSQENELGLTKPYLDPGIDIGSSIVGKKDLSVITIPDTEIKLTLDNLIDSKKLARKRDLVIPRDNIRKKFRTLDFLLSDSTKLQSSDAEFSEPFNTLPPHINQAYPGINASNEHPVVGEVIDLKVTLNDAPSLTATGTVILPDESPAFVFKMRVHLLCANTSEWQDLEYSKAKGTIKSADFEITAPDLNLDANGDYPEREKLLVRANFYYGNRWCGEGRRFLDLRLDGTISLIKKMPKPPKSEWQKCINIEQGTQPPDLLVCIQHQEGNKYHWSFLSPHLEFTGNFNSIMEIPDGAEKWVTNLFEPYADINLLNLERANIEGTGKKIYDSTPKAFKEAYWKLFNKVENFNSIQFVTDESYVPWELMHMTIEGVVPEFLGIRHSVGRWIASDSFRLVQNINVQEFVVTGSDYKSIPNINPLPWVEDELKWLMGRYKSTRITLQSTFILDFLEKGTAQAVHFACHGQNSNRNSLLNELIMEDNPKNIKPLTIDRWEVQNGLGKQHPIIFLNACQAATMGNQLGLIVGLPAAFLAAGASAVICPLWRISDEHAKEITELFYQATFVQSGKTLGEVLQTIRVLWESKHHLTFLAYVLYGDPQARIDFNPQP